MRHGGDEAWQREGVTAAERRLYLDEELRNCAWADEEMLLSAFHIRVGILTSRTQTFHRLIIIIISFAEYCLQTINNANIVTIIKLKLI